MSEIPMKKYTTCGDNKSATEFHKHKGKKDGLRSACKECTNKSNARYREENKEKVQEINNKYRNSNRDKIRERNREYRERNREACIERTKKSIKKNADYYEEYRRNYYKENRERLLEEARELQKTHKYRKGRVVREQRRRALKRSLPNSYSIKDWEKCLEFFGNSCCYCGTEGKLQQDHFIPVSKNGGYVPNNIVPSCPSCNASKNNKDFEDWYKNTENFCDRKRDLIYSYIELMSKEGVS